MSAMRFASPWPYAHDRRGRRHCDTPCSAPTAPHLRRSGYRAAEALAERALVCLAGWMGVLSSLLPGIRHLRAPLAVGYIWLIDVWLLFGKAFPSEAEAEGVIEDLYALKGLVSEVGLGIAISFAAYLIGVLSVAASGWVMRTYWYQDYELLERWRKVQETALLAKKGITLRDLPEDWQDRVPITVNDEEILIRARLMADKPTLFGEFDRLRSEGELRSAIVPPLMVLAGILTFRSQALWSLALVPLVFLWYQALQLRREASFTLLAAVGADQIQSPYLERVEQVIEEAQGSRLPRQSQ
jgi:hypothetical protein